MPLALALLVLSAAGSDTTRPAPAIAIVGATVVPMDRDRTLPNQTVLVRDGRIAAVGPSDSVAVPPGATVIDGRGRYLAPGLADMHVHLPHPRTAPGTFRDAPLYLANGVTTVLNLSGDSTHLAWRSRIAAGTLIGPTLYTSGRFVNEPVVDTPDEVEAEVRAQAAAGYDVIKFREVVDTNLEPLTTHGLSLDAYRRLVRTAHRLGIPITGHAPNNLGLGPVLEEKQSLAHVGYTLVATWFWPRETARFQGWQRASGLSLGALTLLAAIGWIGVMVALARRERDSAPALAVTAGLGTLALGAAVIGALELWDTDRLGDSKRIAAVTVAAAGLAVGALLLGWQALRLRRRAGPTGGVRFHSILSALVALELAAGGLGYWLPLARRSTDGGLARLARDVARSGIWVTPTIQVYRSAEVAANPEVKYVQVPKWWESFRSPSPGRLAWSRGMVTFLERTVGALHRAGVPLLAGTDAHWAFVIPGFALHDELSLLKASGLSPYEVLATATVEPARFLRKADEFGTVAPGRRADLVLVEKNPLTDLATLRRPIGVMARGRWFTAAQLGAMIAPLAEK
jgi:imidazolonepropionase-like amidohydrolase